MGYAHALALTVIVSGGCAEGSDGGGGKGGGQGARSARRTRTDASGAELFSSHCTRSERQQDARAVVGRERLVSSVRPRSRPNISAGGGSGVVAAPRCGH